MGNLFGSVSKYMETHIVLALNPGGYEIISTLGPRFSALKNGDYRNDSI